MKTKRLAIIGAGSSGLVTLKNALDRLPDWEIVCFEKGSTTRGVWGNPYPGFISTSTKYTTQFACYRKWNCNADPADRVSKSDFFIGDEYGQYLEEFADHFGLRKYIHFQTLVRSISKIDVGWLLKIDDGQEREERFDKLVICTSLVAKLNPIDTDIPLLRSIDDSPSGATVVILGGGESAADTAHRLASPSLGNNVFLSLRNGIRVSPRYHPIRGVPSDFLRNRLLLSINRELRNIIGQKFVETRIRHQERFEKFFGGKPDSPERPSVVAEKRKYWDDKLTSRAKDQLFNVFHTKSDDFLDDVAEGRIKIIGPPVDSSYRLFSDFDGTSTQEIRPDFLCPAIGFSSGLEDLSGGEVKVTDFYQGCVHTRYDDLFIIGFARPIIGNIPTISEVQAKYVTGIIAGKFQRPKEIESLHAADRKRIERDFGKLNIAVIYPVEMFPYCDRLAREMNAYPSLRRIGSIRAWIKTWLAPASTTYYVDADYNPKATASEPIHIPHVLTFLLILIKCVERPLRYLLAPGKCK